MSNIFGAWNRAAHCKSSEKALANIVQICGS